MLTSSAPSEDMVSEESRMSAPALNVSETSLPPSAIASSAEMVAGETVTAGSAQVRVRGPVRFSPLTVMLLVTELPWKIAIPSAKSMDVGEAVMVAAFMLPPPLLKRLAQSVETRIASITAWGGLMDVVKCWYMRMPCMPYVAETSAVSFA